jgi:hypothetical protein
LKNNFHYNLNLPVNFLTDFVDDESSMHTSFDINLINYELKQWLSDRDLYIIGECERFLLDPDKINSLLIHIDNPNSKNHVKLNYVFCDTPHTVVWYTLKPGKKLNFSKTSIGTNFAWANEEDCEPIFSTSIGRPSMFNASVLHGVLPVVSKRVTFAMTLARISTGKLISWTDAEEIFKDYIC